MKRTSIEHKYKPNIGACTPASTPPALSCFLPLTYTPNFSIISTATATFKTIVRNLRLSMLLEIYKGRHYRRLQLSYTWRSWQGPNLCGCVHM